MIPVFPTEREAKRNVLLEAVDEVRDVLEGRTLCSLNH
jgi:hypothetical protein